MIFLTVIICPGTCSSCNNPQSPAPPGTTVPPAPPRTTVPPAGPGTNVPPAGPGTNVPPAGPGTNVPPAGSGPAGPQCTSYPCLIFEDEFDYLNLDVWEHEITAGGGGVSKNLNNVLIIYAC